MVNYTGLSRTTIATLLFIEVAVNSLWIAAHLSSIAVSGPRAGALFLARGVVTALELISATFLVNDREGGPTLARRVLLASAVLLTLEVGLRLAPTNLDPTFTWWVVTAYWMYAIAAQWLLRSGRLSR